MGDDVPSVEELIARARAGDANAIDRLFAWCAPLLRKWVSQRLANRQPGIAGRSDIGQDVAERAFLAFPSFKGTTEAEWVSWLQRIVETCTTQSFRDAGRQKRNKAAETPLDEDEIPAQQMSPSQATAAGEQWHELLTQLSQLPEEQQQAIYLCHLKELRVAEVAERMGKTEAAIASLLRRGLRALRERLTDAPEPAPPPAGGDREVQVRDEATAALRLYLRRRDAGERVESSAFIAEHPTCAEELRHMLECIERLQALRAAGPEE
ncbi:RNA polymerase sigma factor [Sorangium sp. So ce341]|uniref:RNA polymerase sigma factor n=1 Tax=Sorangium sp. So ce341 TaxID=3133302 RepID=UPI003F60E5F4